MPKPGRAWLLEYIEPCGPTPVKVRDVEAAAKEAGRWFSKGAFERARGLAAIEPLTATQLPDILGDDYDSRARTARRGMGPPPCGSPTPHGLIGPVQTRGVT